MKKFLKIVGGVIAFFVVIFCIVNLLTAGAKTVAEDAVRSMNKGDIDKAVSYFHESFPNTRAMSQSVHQMAEEYIDFSWHSMSVSGGVTKLEGAAEAASGCTSGFRAKLLDNANGEPKITGFMLDPLCVKDQYKK